MKLSIAWIFDHLEGRMRDFDIPDLVKRISATTAEIEDVQKVTFDKGSIMLARVLESTQNQVTVEIPELKKKVVMPERLGCSVGDLYLVKKQARKFYWVYLSDSGSGKEGLFPEIWCSEQELKGSWKDSLEDTDYIMTLDNKAITHRPDLWGHRGFAREVAALLNLELIPEEHFLAAKPIKHYAKLAPVSATNPFTLEIAHNTQNCNSYNQACRRLAGLYISRVTSRPSALPMALRLARIDARPLNLLVDCTNYVMFDVGQPMHAFDAATLKNHKISARCACDGEKLELLDGDTVTLSAHDCVIADAAGPIALAGIMGGKATAVTKQTSSLFIESGNFDATTVRKTSARVKKRTEASTRFEKSLDPNQNTQALLRFLKLLETYKIQYQAADALASVGPLSHEIILEVSHEFICSRLGLYINTDKIEQILTKLGFGVQTHNNTQTLYTITVPTFRSTKDITLPIDIVEEVARFIGYDYLPAQLPERAMAPFSLEQIMRLRMIKQHMAFGLTMHEVQTYALYDEEFLRQIHYNPSDTLRVANPLSEHWQRLVTSLVPNLLKALSVNSARQQPLRFFECNRVWFLDTQPVERKELAGLFFDPKKQIDFYQAKAAINTLFSLLKIDVEWVKPTGTLAPWYALYQVTEITHKGRTIGRAGKVSPVMLARVAEGDAFIFELDASFLLQYTPETSRFKPLSKYPEVHLDISMFVDYQVTVAQLEHAIKTADKRITHVTLLDVYEKPEWGTRKSVALSVTIADETKTLTKEEIDLLWTHVLKNVKKYGAEIR